MVIFFLLLPVNKFLLVCYFEEIYTIETTMLKNVKMVDNPKVKYLLLIWTKDVTVYLSLF